MVRTREQKQGYANVVLQSTVRNTCRFAFDETPSTMLKTRRLVTINAAASITVFLAGEQARAEQLKVITPSMWKAELKSETDNRMQLTISAPNATNTREARVMIQGLAEGTVTAEVVLAIPIKRE